MSSSRGSSTVEFVLLAPVLVLMITFVAAFGRVVNTSISVGRASEDAARAASMVSSQRMASTARLRVISALGEDSGCVRPRAQIKTEKRGSSVTVTVAASCDLNRAGITSIIPFGRTFTSESTEVVDVFTYR